MIGRIVRRLFIDSERPRSATPNHTSMYEVRIVHGVNRTPQSLVDRSCTFLLDNHLARGLFALDHVGEETTEARFREVHGALQELWDAAPPKLRADYEERAGRLLRLMMALD